MKFFKFLFILSVCFFYHAVALAATPDWQNDKLQINVYAEPVHKTFQVLVNIRMLNGWHISWDNPGDAGTPVQFSWQLPEGWTAKRLQESTPQKFIYGDIISQYGYGGSAYYLFEIETGSTKLTTFPAEIFLKINWTACRDFCEPEHAVLRISETAPDDWTAQLNAAQQTFPETAAGPAYAQNINGVLKLVFPSRNFNLQTSPFYFIPYERRLISAETPQTKQLNPDNRLEIQVEAQREGFIPKKGVLLYGKKAYKYDVLPLDNMLSENNDFSLWILLLLAFAGGLALNCMPCVFPVLSLKAISLAQSIRQDGHIHRGLLYLSGVLSCFMLMAFLLYLLRGSSFGPGWGFQLQSPVFTALMLGIFILLFLMMTDIIKIHGRWLTVLDRFSGINSFMTGFFAVLIASPCTGPFMGAALGYALFQPPQIYFPFFLSLGLGYALPFALAEMYPAVVRRILPKPGKWMNIFKKILSIPILLTCLWLGWVLYHLTNIPDRQAESESWQPYHEQTVLNHVHNGRGVFIDFTAKWCMTCLANEKLVLDTKRFSDFAKDNNIVLFKADWTTENPDITRALNRYNRSSVPLYVYYPPQKTKGQNNDFIILPQILTFNIIRKYLNAQNQDND